MAYENVDALLAVEDIPTANKSNANKREAAQPIGVHLGQNGAP